MPSRTGAGNRTASRAAGATRGIPARTAKTAQTAKTAKTAKTGRSAKSRAGKGNARSTAAAASKRLGGSAARGAKRIRYAVVGAGYISQVAMLPAFARASRNSELVALVSDDDVKRDKLGRKYGARITCGYDGYDRLLQSGDIDALYIGLPNHLHADFAIRAAGARVHVLCDKPLAVNGRQCLAIADAVRASGIKFMVAYRLHFDAANLAALELARSGRLGELRFFSSDFSMQVEEGNIRLRADTGGGTLYDIGIYCINAARTLFGAEPEEVVAFSVRGTDERFRSVDEATGSLLRFPGARLAAFTTSFGAADTGTYRLVGTKGDLCVDSAYEFKSPIRHELTVKGRTSSRSFARRDQFAAEFLYFSDCILNDEEPEPSAAEGLADVRVIEALYESARTGRPVRLAPFDRGREVDLSQKISRPAGKAPKLVHADDPSPEKGEEGS
ncbi:MAG TPA: Gfo/Idh/MocA family oxidoreductase [Planctomycetota bacterium]|nr:Gfo/Idh/MocA family oxidoreductase [Planctomycetota bacterium]